jgi:hypothetical protein
VSNAPLRNDSPRCLELVEDEVFRALMHSKL